MGKRADIRVRFGQAVRTLRAKLGLTQEDFAHKCGLDRTYVSGIERGHRNVSLCNIEVIADTLGVTLADLFQQV